MSSTVVKLEIIITYSGSSPLDNPVLNVPHSVDIKHFIENKSVHNFLRHPASIQTHKLTESHNLLGGGNIVVVVVNKFVIRASESATVQMIREGKFFL